MSLTTLSSNVAVNGNVVIEDGAPVLLCDFSVIRGEVTVGPGTQISHNTTIISWTHNYAAGHNDLNEVRHKPIRIGKNVLIGASVVILGGVVIEDNAIIGAGSVVTEDTHVGHDEIWYGVPARFVRMRS